MSLMDTFMGFQQVLHSRVSGRAITKGCKVLCNYCSLGSDTMSLVFGYTDFIHENYASECWSSNAEKQSSCDLSDLMNPNFYGLMMVFCPGCIHRTYISTHRQDVQMCLCRYIYIYI